MTQTARRKGLRHSKFQFSSFADLMLSKGAWQMLQNKLSKFLEWIINAQVKSARILRGLGIFISLFFYQIALQPPCCGAIFILIRR